MICKDLTEYCKAPDESLSYGFDWATWLEGGETILTSTWVVEAGLSSQNESSNSTITGIILSGGSLGESYIVRNQITTTTMTAERAIKINVQYR